MPCMRYAEGSPRRFLNGMYTYAYKMDVPAGDAPACGLLLLPVRYSALLRPGVHVSVVPLKNL